MKIFTTTLLFFIAFLGFSQNELNEQLLSIEKTITKNSMNSFQKLEIDLDNDADLDYIYLYQCAEPKCVEIYLNIDGKLKKSIFELCYNYYLYKNESIKNLIIKQNHCCGESPFTSIRNYNFITDKESIQENYVIFNESHELLNPDLFLKKPYHVKISKENYNVRFSPNIKEYSEDESIFSCELHTNIIGKLKQNSELKVLAELLKEKRTWLFVEIDNEHLNEVLCDSPITYDFENQKLRGWISSKFVEKTKN